LISYEADTRKDWPSAIPVTHWDFLRHTRKWFQTAGHIFVHAMVESGLEMADQPDYIMLWEDCAGMRPHRSGKKVICGHSPQKSGKPERYDFGCCIDTGVHKGGWLTCLNVESGEYWQANEDRDTRAGILEVL